MNLIASYRHNGQNQRQLVKCGNVTYRRIVALVDNNKLIQLDKPIWQEQIHTGEFHNIIQPMRLMDLEDVYQKDIKEKFWNNKLTFFCFNSILNIWITSNN